MSYTLAIRIIDKVFRDTRIGLNTLFAKFFIFGFSGKIPLSTKVFGRIRLGHRPCHLVLGKNCAIGDNAYFSTTREASIELGDGVSINIGTILVAMSSIKIGSNTAIGEYVSIRDQDHKFSPESGVRGKGFHHSPIEIGDNVWIGRGVHIGPGAVVGSGCIIAANSVVRGTFPDNALIAGTPAVIKRRIAPGGERQPNPVPSDMVDSAQSAGGKS